MKPKLTIRKCYKHWKTIRRHRKLVKYYCRLAGIRWRGIKHDLSKYNPIEFFESARYYTGTTSPIDEAKRAQGYSRAWLHHRGRNTHHYEYYVDNFDDGGVSLLMPKDDFVELVCDYIAAGITYTGAGDRVHFSFSNEYDWWMKKREHCIMHPANKMMLDVIFRDLEYADNHMLSGCPTALITSTPESLIKSGYLQEIWHKYKNYVAE